MTGPIIPEISNVPVGMAGWVRTVKAAIDLLQKQVSQIPRPSVFGKVLSPVTIVQQGGAPRIILTGNPDETPADGGAIYFTDSIGNHQARLSYQEQSNLITLEQLQPTTGSDVTAWNKILMTPRNLDISSTGVSLTSSIFVSPDAMIFHSGQPSWGFTFEGTIFVNDIIDLNTFAATIYCNPADTTSSTANAFVNATNGRLSRSTSSVRYKTKIRKAPGLVGVLEQLRAVVFRDKGEAAELGKAAPDHVGYTAEDVAGIPGGEFFLEYRKDENGDDVPDSVRYALFVVPLVQAYQQQQRQIADLTARVEKLEAG